MVVFDCDLELRESSCKGTFSPAFAESELVGRPFPLVAFMLQGLSMYD
jgi:hypothetical protein